MIKVLTTAIIVAMSMLFVQVYFTSEAQKETAIYKSKLDSLQYVVDSLKNETFILETNVTRYEIAARTLEEENPKAGAEFQYYLTRGE